MGLDAERPLTEKGVRKVQDVAAALSRRGTDPDAVVTSPYARALQTAQIVAAVLQIPDALSIDPRLEPGFGPAELEAVLADYEGAEALLLVGHEPDFSAVVGGIIGGGDLLLKKGGVALVELAPGEPARGTLVWLSQPRHLGA
jgi:phosphohistidine phosphatase